MRNVTEKDSYEMLANAIILEAVRDYRRALRSLKRNPGNKAAAEMAVECEGFFRSDYFELLTSIDGERLISDLRKEFI